MCVVDTRCNNRGGHLLAQNTDCKKCALEKVLSKPNATRMQYQKLYHLFLMNMYCICISCPSRQDHSLSLTSFSSHRRHHVKTRHTWISHTPIVSPQRCLCPSYHLANDLQFHPHHHRDFPLEDHRCHKIWKNGMNGVRRRKPATPAMLIPAEVPRSFADSQA